jgi:hypothetical protein
MVFVAYVYIWRKGGFDWVGEPAPVGSPELVERGPELQEAHDAR